MDKDSSDKDEYKVADEVRVTAVLKNVSNDLAWVRLNYPELFYDMDVRLPFPAWINFRPRAVLTEFGQRKKNPRMANFAGGTLQPGREMVNEFALSKFYDLSTIGDYRITFSCKVPLKELKDPRVVVISNEIKITVRSR